MTTKIDKALIDGIFCFEVAETSEEGSWDIHKDDDPIGFDILKTLLLLGLTVRDNLDPDGDPTLWVENEVGAVRRANEDAHRALRRDALAEALQGSQPNPVEAPREPVEMDLLLTAEDEGGWSAMVAEVGGAITQGATAEQVEERMREALALLLDDDWLNADPSHVRFVRYVRQAPVEG